MTSNVLVLVFLLGYATPSALGFQCYVCNSKNDTDCGSPPSERHLKNCDDLHYENNNQRESFKVCRLQFMQSEGIGVVYDRRCGWKKHNENRESCILTPDPFLKATNCECHTDRCNPATWNQSSFALVSVLTALGVFVTARVR